MASISLRTVKTWQDAEATVYKLPCSPFHLYQVDELVELALSEAYPSYREGQWERC